MYAKAHSHCAFTSCARLGWHVYQQVRVVWLEVGYIRHACCRVSRSVERAESEQRRVTALSPSLIMRAEQDLSGDAHGGFERMSAGLREIGTR